MSNRNITAAVIVALTLSLSACGGKYGSAEDWNRALVGVGKEFLKPTKPLGWGKDVGNQAIKAECYEIAEYFSRAGEYGLATTRRAVCDTYPE